MEFKKMNFKKDLIDLCVKCTKLKPSTARKYAANMANSYKNNQQYNEKVKQCLDGWLSTEDFTPGKDGQYLVLTLLINGDIVTTKSFSISASVHDYIDGKFVGADENGFIKYTGVGSVFLITHFKKIPDITDSITEQVFEYYFSTKQ
jgi:hypothetical protein